MGSESFWGELFLFPCCLRFLQELPPVAKTIPSFSSLASLGNYEVMPLPCSSLAARYAPTATGQ